MTEKRIIVFVRKGSEYWFTFINEKKQIIKANFGSFLTTWKSKDDCLVQASLKTGVDYVAQQDKIERISYDDLDTEFPILDQE